MLVLIGCEESQEVCKAFRERGHEAYSCDLLPCSGGHPEWHLQMDVFKAIAGGSLVTQSGQLVEIKKWDIGIFFPTCTYLTISANKWYKNQPQPKSGALVGAERRQARKDAIKFFKALAACDIERTALENPIGIMSTEYREPDQIVNPYDFGDAARKPTCLWLKGLPKLQATNLGDAPLFGEMLDRGEFHTTKSGKCLPKWYNLPPSENRGYIRSKTFPGIAKAMAEQWG